MVHRRNPSGEILVYVGACCIDVVGDTDATRAGCTVVYGTRDPEHGTTTGRRTFSFALEEHGPTAWRRPPSLIRGQLRAAIAALECRDWSMEGWNEITIAVDSKSIVNGITKRAAKWLEDDWRPNLKKGFRLPDSDLWLRLLHLVNEHAARNLCVKFMKISMDRNEEAIRLASHAAKKIRPTCYIACDLNELSRK